MRAKAVFVGFYLGAWLAVLPAALCSGWGILNGWRGGLVISALEVWLLVVLLALVRIPRFLIRQRSTRIPCNADRVVLRVAALLGFVAFACLIMHFFQSNSQSARVVHNFPVESTLECARTPAREVESSTQKKGDFIGPDTPIPEPHKDTWDRGEWHPYASETATSDFNPSDGKPLRWHREGGDWFWDSSAEMWFPTLTLSEINHLKEAKRHANRRAH